MDIAPLGFFVDTTGLVAGAKAVDQFTVNVGKAGEATDRMSQKVGGAGKAGNDAAAGLGRAGAAAGQAAQNADKLGKATETATSKFQQFVQRLAQARQGMVDSSNGATGFVGKLGAVNQMLGDAQQAAGATAAALGVGTGGLTGAFGGVIGAAGLAGRGIMAVGAALGPVGALAAGATAAIGGLSVTLADNQDRWNQYRQRLGVALESIDAATASVDRLSVIADQTGSSMDAIMRSFQRFATVRTEIGATVQELEMMTKAIVQLGTLSGTSQGEMQGAMLQFSQALAAGRLNGDELRSIMESMQPLLREIAIGMGVSVGEMRKLGAEGELTADKIFEALMSRIDEIDAMSQSIDGTSERSQQRMANQYDRMLANMGEFIEASENVQAVYNGIADILGTINGLLDDSEEGSGAMAARAQRQIDLARWSAQNIPLVGGLIGAGFNYAAGNTISDARAASAAEAKAAAGPVNEMEKLESLQEKLSKYTKSQTSEYLKQFEQLEKMRKVQDDIAKRRADVVQLEAMGQRERQAALNELEQRGSEIAVLEFKAMTGDEKAKEALDAARERFNVAKAALEDVVESNKLLDMIQSEVDRKVEDLAQGPLAGLRRETERLQEAMLRGGGGMVELYTKAAELAEQANKSNLESSVSTQEALSVLIEQRRTQAQSRIADMGYSASLQEQLAGRLGAGENRVAAEVEVEALTWAFGQFGSALEDNMDVVNSYTGALLRMRAAQQQVADAAELESIERSIKGTEASIAVIGAGGYAERLAAFSAQQEQFRSDRAQMRDAFSGAQGARPAGATATSGAGMSDIISTIRYLETRNRDYSRPGVPMQSPAGALFAMQVMPDTARDPGFGISPAKSRTPGEYNRVGEQLIAALLERYDGDIAKALGAYHSGQGRVDKAVRARGQNWASALGPVGRAYVSEGVQRLGGQVAGQIDGAPYDPAGFDNSTTALGEAQRRQFDLQEQMRALIEIDRATQETANNRLRIAVVGNDAAERELELKLRIEDATKNIVDGPERQRLAAAMRTADEVTRELEVRRQIAQVSRSNEDRERRLGVMGDPAEERKLVLQLEIERIRRTMPEGQQGAAIANARSGFELDTDEAMARARIDREARARSLQEQLYLTQFIGEELAVQEVIQRRQEELRQKGIEVGSDEMEQQLALEEVFARQEIRVRAQLQQRLAMRDAYLQAADEIGEGFSKMFSFAFREGEVKANFALRAIELAFYNMLDRIVQQLVISPLIDVIGKVFGMAFGAVLPGLGSAGGGLSLSGSSLGGLGAAIPSGNGALGGVIPAANGMVVNTPTRIKGGKYLTGEGPGLYEAIMPLTRGPDGKLGVSAAGGGGGGGGRTTVVVNDMRGSKDAEAVEIEERQTGDGMREINVMIRDAVRGSIRSGAFDGDNKAVYGISRTVTRR
jgi:tape measure domain-containing protein